MNDKNEFQNVYALNIEGKEIHISDAKSGLQGYYCLGCEREMQAVKAKKAGRVSYFRHDPKAVKVGGKCTYSDETYRHKIAKEILQRIKKIKVPSLYKFPPKGQDGKANLIENSRVIEAHHVGVERRFYENLEGQVISGEEVIEGSQFNVIRPDITFFDKEGQPILFIEIVATHKLSNEKKVKLKRLGIDTVQITIPRDRPEDIEKIFHVTKSTKWIYNHAEANAAYIPIPETSSEGISSIDKLQRDLFEEDVRCRLSQIGSLIRTINRCLESKPYREIENRIRSEIRRVEGNTERETAELEGLRKQHRENVETKFRGEIKNLESRRQKFESEFENLETRYFRKRREIEDAINRIREESGDVENSGVEFAKKEKEINENIRREKLEIATIEQEERDLPTYTRSVEKQLRSEYSELEEQIGRSEKVKLETEGRRVRSAIDKTRHEIEATEKEEIELPATERRTQIQLRTRIERLTREVVEQNEEGIKKQAGDFSREYQDLVRAGEQVEDIHEAEITHQRKRAARECFKSGAWKSWPR
ncbi:MAG: hypothetical protein ABJF04_25740 [Reichenbachiella sp.]|uniref:hypothetical protein n=1 Tax=Reichenbachiella sp. TaxID=2184521 RepID=UPI00326482D1